MFSFTIASHFWISANSVIRNMDSSVHPCDDFYQFACGRFLKETQIPEDKTSVTTFSIIGDLLLDQLKVIVTEPVQETDIKPYKLAKYLYKACMDKSKYAMITLRNKLKVFGDHMNENSRFQKYFSP
jgi:predicted metalloendopeptidase